MFPLCSVNDAGDEAFNLPGVGRDGGPPHSRRLIAKTMSLGQGGGDTRNVDGGSRFGPRCSADDGARAASRDACHALP